ncbi:MAG: cyclic nucleotide-binding domain-containing protein [Chloroflexi bacterium]|nr:cyclic nucleotide-binding domain-containing protein [Chloroflexota bacterium]
MVAIEDLKKNVVLSPLSDADLGIIAEFVQEKQYEAGTTIFQEGDSATELLIVQEGRVALQMTLSGADAQTSRRITVDVADRNDVIGWSFVVDPYKYTLTAVCLQPVKALSVAGDRLRWLLRDNPGIGYEVLKGLIRVVASRLDETRRILITERSSL